MNIEKSFVDRILNWNEAAGNTPPAIGTLDEEALRLQCKFISEEFTEVMDELAVVEIDPTKIAKELADLIFTSIEGIRRAGFDPEVIMQLVCDSNDSKFSANEKEVREAKAFFNKRRIAVVTESTPDGMVVFMSAKDQEVNGRMISKGKVLKSPSYYEAEPAIREYHNEIAATQELY